LASQATIKQKATEHAARGEYDLAIEEYNKILSENDNDAAVHNLVGDTYLKMGSKEQAIEEFERAVEIYAEDAFYTNAVAVCKKILRADGERASVYEDLAELYRKQGLLGEAVANYKEFADRMKAKGDLEKVFVTYQAVKELMPKKVDTRLALADMYLARNRSDDAVSELKEVAKLYREQDKIEQAEEVEERIVGLGGSMGEEPLREEPVSVPPAEAEPSPETGEGADFYSQFQAVPPGVDEAGAGAAGLTEAGTGEEGAALAVEEPPAAEALGPLGGDEITFEQTTSDLETERVAAEATTEEALELEEEPEPAEAPAGAEPVEKAEGQYEPMFKSSPTDWASYIELGDLCLSVGSTDEAMEYYYKAADAFFEEKGFERAAEIYEKIAEIKPLELRPRQRLAQIAQKKGDSKLMISAYTSLAECLDKRGAAKEADTVYRKLLAVDPNNRLAKSRVSGLGEEPIESYAEEPTFIEPEPKRPAPPAPEPERRRLQVAPEPETAPAGTISFDDVIAEVTSEADAPSAGAGEDAGAKTGLLSMSEVLREFKEGVEENIPAGDFSSHYDLGITYKEMGLLDEAVLEFEKASKGAEMAAKAFEMLGRIYLEKREFKKAVLYLKEGLESKVDMPEEHVGLYYSLGLAHEAVGENDKASEAYLKVRDLDPNFADIEARLEAVGAGAAAVEEGTTPEKEEKPSEERPVKKKGKISYV
jgi:tetratricopeptide (TPR) repeat protein